MRTCPYRLQLTAGDKRAVARWRRNIWIGYFAVAIVLILGSVVFASDPKDRSGLSRATTAQVVHFGVDELARVLVPERDAARANTASAGCGASRSCRTGD